ncbi:MAG TPA: HAMP domain-containing sensor histidine kinase [Roseiflexaceae bacterium]|nr:HAMP domain-containing sensor histidine kinase [Roseiflexaceae bacterium]
MNNSLLAVGLTLGAVVSAVVGLQLGEGRLTLSVLQASLLMIVGTWLLIAYLFSRARRHRIAGGMIVMLTVSALALAIYLLPEYLLAFLPFGSLPIALSALLLSRRAVYITTVLTIAALFGAQFAALQLPPPPLGLALPPPSVSISINMSVLALFFLAMIVAPLRGELARLFEQLRQREAAQARAEQSQRAAEGARDDALEQLERQQRNLQLVADHVGDGVIAVSASGQITRANAIACSLWAEIASGDLIGQRFDQLRATLTGPTAAAQYVDIIDLPSGAAERGDGYTHILLDRRERARLARLRGELLGLLADEMRNPLTSMVTALEMTLGQNLPDGADRVLVGARRSGQRLLDLVTTMLEINQIEQNPNVLRRVAAPLRPILDAGIAQTTALQHQGAVTVVVEYSGDGTVMIDGERMRRAFVHLLEHALRHSPPYSTVQVRTECQSETLVVRISDQGPGLTPQQRDSLFEQRATPEERNAPALGLAFSKLVIETHGGRILVESSGSQGSTYAFTLPIERRTDT